MKYRVPNIEIQDQDPFREDVLDRKEYVGFLTPLIGRLTGPFVLAIDSPWGTGKTTLVRMLQAELQRQKYECIYFNAWEVDFLADPLVPLVAAIDDLDLGGAAKGADFQAHMRTARKITTAVAKRGLVAAAKAATLGALDLSEDIEAIGADLAGDTTTDLVQTFKKERSALEALRESLGRALATLQTTDRNPTLIFFIDELDRCRPTFAVETLERIKHLFDIENIIFVLSVDKTQLEASVGAIYGANINAREYLRRFIDLEFGVPNPRNSERYTGALLTRFGLDEVFEKRVGEVQYDKQNFVDFFSALADAFQLSLRARERCITRLCVVLDQTPSNHYLEPILVALLVVLRAKEPELFLSLCSGITSPEVVFEKLRSFAAGERLLLSREGILLEAYLRQADPDQDRRDAGVFKLKAQAENAEGTSAQVRAKEVLSLMEHVRRGWRDPSLKRVAQKVDLAAQLAK